MKYNEVIIPPEGKLIQLVIDIVHKYFKYPKPYYVVPGNGEIILEWKNGEDIVALTLEADNDHSIFFRFGTDYPARLSNLDELDFLLSQLYKL